MDCIGLGEVRATLWLVENSQALRRHMRSGWAPGVPRDLDIVKSELASNVVQQIVGTQRVELVKIRALKAQAYMNVR